MQFKLFNSFWIFIELVINLKLKSNLTLIPRHLDNYFMVVDQLWVAFLGRNFFSQTFLLFVQTTLGCLSIFIFKTKTTMIKQKSQGK